MSSSVAIRRAQLVAPFGVGAMSVFTDGTTVITAGLDAWFRDENQCESTVDESLIVHDWRLECRLGASSFRLPPAQNKPENSKKIRQSGTKELAVPAFRFPRWHVCPYCNRLNYCNLELAQSPECPDDRHDPKRRRPKMQQVPLVVICEAGHIDDFPFREWVHRDSAPECDGVIRLRSTGIGGAFLGMQQVSCDSCGKKRYLREISDAFSEGEEEHTVLSAGLSSEEGYYLCSGSRPWLADRTGICGEELWGALKGAGNVYFPKIESSIFLPSCEGVSFSDVTELFCSPKLRPHLQEIQSHVNESNGPLLLRKLFRTINLPELCSLSDETLISAYQCWLNNQTLDVPSVETTADTDAWRFPEYVQIRKTTEQDELVVRDPGIHEDLQKYLQRIRELDVLRETRVLRGFTRVFDDELDLETGKALLRRCSLTPDADWLPAYVVKGEGIYIELNSERLSDWESRSCVQQRVEKISKHLRAHSSGKKLANCELSPRFVLLHTLSHMLINELVFACGYSSASLRERIYASSQPMSEMNGLLIYTAAGDSEGTLGGLARMALPARIHSTFRAAIQNARWCATDPVCMEMGEHGQGPQYANLAACYACALVPETSCEELNRFLDRGLLIGSFDNPDLGYFSDFC